ncbi:unnamed protein product [Caenorhabditis nigoni]
MEFHFKEHFPGSRTNPDTYIEGTIVIHWFPLAVFVGCCIGFICLIVIGRFKCVKVETSQNVTGNSDINLKKVSKNEEPPTNEKHVFFLNYIP